MSQREFIFPSIASGEEPYNAMIKGMLIHDDKMHEYLDKLDGLVITGYLQVMTCETTIEFDYMGHSFTADNASMVWTFYTDLGCPDDVIKAIINHLNIVT